MCKLILGRVMVGNLTEVNVFVNNNISLTGKVVRTYPEYDLALVEVSNISTIPLALADSTGKTGEEIYVIGTPVMTKLHQTVTKGIISNHRIMENKRYVQLDASVSPGNSGGPLLNKQGYVIGVVNAKVIGGGAEGIGFAIPIDVVLEKLNISKK